jgi:branched-chain amino acid transport system ATP-binding protein
MPAATHHPATEVVLQARGLRKEFRGYTAVGGVDLDVHRGEVAAAFQAARARRTPLSHHGKATKRVDIAPSN